LDGAFVEEETEKGALHVSGHKTIESSEDRDKTIHKEVDEGIEATESTNARAGTPVPDVACRPSVAMREASTGEKGDTDPNFDATSGPSSVIACATLFVAVSAIFNVPAKLLRSTDACASADARDEVLMRESGKVATINDADVAAVTPRTNDDWGRHGYIIAEIYKIIATMEPPWGSQCVFEAAARRFPDVDTTALRMAVLAVLMTQRQCVRDLTLAGARRGPRRDENGEVFIELDLVYANRYSDSY